MGRGNNRAKYAKCVEKRDIQLTSKDTLRQIIWRVCPYLATSVTKYSGQEMLYVVMFQGIMNSIDIQCVFDTIFKLRNVVWIQQTKLICFVAFQNKKGPWNPQQFKPFCSSQTIKILALTCLKFYSFVN